jgi:hypothetical protein
MGGAPDLLAAFAKTVANFFAGLSHLTPEILPGAGNVPMKMIVGTAAAGESQKCKQRYQSHRRTSTRVLSTSLGAKRFRSWVAR